MKRGVVNLIIDLTAAGLFLGLLATGYVMRFILPPGTHRTLRLWGLNRHDWGEIHFWVSAALLGVVVLHLCLHWQWVVSMVGRSILRARTASTHLLRTGLVTALAVAAVFALFAWSAHRSVREVTEAAPNAHATADAGASAVKQDRREIDFWKAIYPIFERSCLSCHGSRKQLGGFRADRREDFLGGDGRRPQVIPGKSGESPLVAIISGRKTDMLMADRHQLPAGEVRLLEAWIDAGAAWPDRPGR